MHHIVYIGIGSNLGNRAKYIKDAIEHLNNDQSVQVLDVSDIYETDPLDDDSGSKYMNGVLKLESKLNPFELLRLLNGVENKLKRVRTVKNASRTIDLDILLYDGIVLNTKKLTIPHPKMHEREFVLKGLGQLEPSLERAFREKG